MLLSVIIPGYNTPAKWWIRCIKSVENAIRLLSSYKQQLPIAEIICIDDGSDKNPIPSSLNVQDEIVLLHIIRLSKNIGQASARNQALDIAQGEFITFVDSDDEVREMTYKICIDKLINTGADVCLYGVTPIWTCESLLKHDIPENDIEDIQGNITESGIPSASQVEKWYKKCLLNYVSNKVIRHSSLIDKQKNDIRFDSDGMPCEDIIFYLELLIAKTKWCAVNYDGYIYYRNGNTSVSYYKICYTHGVIKCADTWRRFCESRFNGFEYCGYHSKLSSQELKSCERKNLLGKGSPLWYAKLYQLIRQILYIRPIRRWHLMKIYPNIIHFK